MSTMALEANADVSCAWKAVLDARPAKLNALLASAAMAGSAFEAYAAESDATAAWLAALLARSAIVGIAFEAYTAVLEANPRLLKAFDAYAAVFEGYIRPLEAYMATSSASCARRETSMRLFEAYDAVLEP
jgi:hypothetical protein